MTLHPGRWIYVWQDPPADRALDGYEGALVRAANGVGTTNPAGFDFAANYDRWVARFGAARVSPWTYLYPSSDGARAARALFGSAGRRAEYQVDLEDAVPPATVRAFCDTLHTLAPGCQLIFDSYPTRAQFVRVNGAAGAATWDQAARSFDAFCPQVYYSSQRDDGWEREFAGKPITPAFSPASWAAWDYFQRNLNTYGSAKLWRYPLTDAWRGRLTYRPAEEDDMFTDTDRQNLVAVKTDVDALQVQVGAARTQLTDVQKRVATNDEALSAGLASFRMLALALQAQGVDIPPEVFAGIDPAAAVPPQWVAAVTVPPPAT